MLYERGLFFALNTIGIFVAPLISLMANTGGGTDRCLHYKCLPVPVYHYSPIPDIEELEKRKVWERISPLNGVNFQKDEQVRFLTQLGEQFGNECKWPGKPEIPGQFYLNNHTFSYGCASCLYSMIRLLKPEKIMEIGSGNSTFVIQEALSKNAIEKGIKGDHTVVDPFPNPGVVKTCDNKYQIIDKPVEILDISLFSKLQRNDILFIDSSHIAKTGSDVNFLILDVLPILNPGVVVHFHDIGLPYEYPKTYYTNPHFRVFFNESYMLQAFLSCNNQFEILLAMNYLMVEHSALFRELFPHHSVEDPPVISGGFWIRKV
jgi:hypothetical protein